MKKVAALLVLALAAFALVACGGDDDDTTTTAPTTTETSGEAAGGGEAADGEAGAGGGAGGGVSTIRLEAVPDTGLAYTTDQVSASAGDITIDFVNPQTLTHDVAVEDNAGNQLGKTDLIADSSTSVTLEDVKPGNYTFYCTVPGHREGGMEGTLTVK